MNCKGDPGASCGPPISTSQQVFRCQSYSVGSFPPPPSANHLEKQRRRHTCCRQFGVTKSWGTLWPRMAGTRATSRYGMKQEITTKSSSHQQFSYLLFFSPTLLFIQPTVTATPKSAKNGKSAYDDTTLPLMEKNQGLCSCVCMNVAAPTSLMGQMGWMRRR